MTDLKNTELFEKNWDVFRRYVPNVFAQLNNLEKLHSELIFDEDGNPNISFRGQTLYDCKISDYVEKQINNHYNRPQTIFLSPPQTNNMDDVGVEFNYQTLKRSVEEEGVTFQTEPVEEEANYIIVLGVGLGQHIMPLAKRSNCCGMVLLEPNIEFIYQSLYVTDWEEIFEHFKGPSNGRYCTLYSNSSAIYNNGTIQNFVRGINPAFCDGVQVIEHYPSSVLMESKKLFVKEASMALTGLGFYLDEEIMVRNSYFNLKDYDSYIFQETDKKIPIPVFVIGSGPSLDQSLDYIRDNQHNAIIVSGGTSLKPLLKHGIHPDFHVEIENVEVVIDILQKLDASFDLSDITLVASTTMQPDAVKCFKETIFFFRQSLASNPIFRWGPENQLREVSPTVTNAALSFAQQIGAKELYLFGLDYGARQADKMHVDGTPYDDDVVYDRKFNKKVKGNFGGHVYTDHILNWARFICERGIRRFQNGHKYYNCSDGAYIDKTIPRLPRSLKPLPGLDKKPVKAGLLSNMPLYSQDAFHKAWFAKDWKQEALDLMDSILEILEEEKAAPCSQEYPNRYLEKIARKIVTDDALCTPAMFMLRGSVFLMFMTAVYYPPRVKDKEKRLQVHNIVVEELINASHKLKERISLFYDTLDPDSEQPFNCSALNEEKMET